MESWVTLATNDSYSVGALVLAASLRRANTTRNLSILVTKGISSTLLQKLQRSFDKVVTVEPLDSEDAVNLSLMNRPDLGVTLTKLHCWTLTQFAKCVFLDADTLVVANCDDLFDREEFSAAPDAGWPDCFNSGVFVFRPSVDTFKSILQFAGTHGSFDGGDQGLLNHYFSSWATEDISKHLPFLYNMAATATYTYQPAYKHFGAKVKIVHFLGSNKPWHVLFSADGEPSLNSGQLHDAKHLQLWWRIFSEDVKPSLERVGEGGGDRVGEGGDRGEGAMASVCSADRVDLRENWEQGRPDFAGTAAFENIIQKISTTINISQSPETENSTSTASTEQGN